MLLQLGKHELTDQSCSQCGALDPRTDSIFHCDICGHTDSRPRNTAELLARIGNGDPPPDYSTQIPPSGKDGVNTRGVRKGQRGRERRNENGHAKSRSGARVREAPTISQNARKDEDPPRQTLRAQSDLQINNQEGTTVLEESPPTTLSSA